MPVFPAAPEIPGLPGSELVPYGYEFNGFGFGAASAVQVEKMSGLLGGSVVRGSDVDFQHRHGSAIGTTTLGKRTFSFDVNVLIGGGGSAMEDMLVQLGSVFQIPSLRRPKELKPFCFWRPGQPKKFVMARVNKRDFDSIYNVAHGKASGSLEFVAPDPLIYALDVKAADVILGPGQTTVPFPACDNDGNHVDGTGNALIQINGPCTNPVIQNDSDEGRALRFDVVVPSGGGIRVHLDTWVVERYTGGVWVLDHGILRSDSRFFRLMPGANDLVYSRAVSGSGVGSHAYIWYYDAWS